MSSWEHARKTRGLALAFFIVAITLYLYFTGFGKNRITKTEILQSKVIKLCRPEAMLCRIQVETDNGKMVSVILPREHQVGLDQEVTLQKITWSNGNIDYQLAEVP